MADFKPPLRASSADARLLFNFAPDSMARKHDLWPWAASLFSALLAEHSASTSSKGRFTTALRELASRLPWEILGLSAEEMAVGDASFLLWVVDRFGAMCQPSFPSAVSSFDDARDVLTALHHALEDGASLPVVTTPQPARRLALAPSASSPPLDLSSPAAALIMQRLAAMEETLSRLAQATPPPPPRTPLAPAPAASYPVAPDGLPVITPSFVASPTGRPQSPSPPPGEWGGGGGLGAARRHPAAVAASTRPHHPRRGQSPAGARHHRHHRGGVRIPFAGLVPAGAASPPARCQGQLGAGPAAGHLAADRGAAVA